METTAPRSGLSPALVLTAAMAAISPGEAGHSAMPGAAGRKGDRVSVSQSFLIPGAKLVTKVADTNDGVCDADCSLREAIDVAMSGDIIQIDPALAGGTINLAAAYGELLIDKSLTIIGIPGAGITIDAGENGRIFNVDDGDDTVPGTITADLFGLTLTGGQAENGGAILNQNELLIVRDSVITGNEATTGFGGGISAVSGAFRLIDSEISDNEAYDGGGGLDLYAGEGLPGTLAIIRDSFIRNNTSHGEGEGYGGGGVYAGGTRSLFIENTEITGNTAEGSEGGGGLWLDNIDGNVTLVGSLIDGNKATDGPGGGLGVDDFEGYGFTVELRDTTVSNNQASGEGGGVYFYDDQGGQLRIVAGSSIVGNVAGRIDAGPISGGEGGGIWFDGAEYAGRLLIEDSTVSGNTAFGDGGGIYLYAHEASIHLLNATVSDNKALDGGYGGGLSFYADDDLEGEVVIRKSHFTNNKAEGSGGGLALSLYEVERLFLIEESEFTGNQAGYNAGEGRGGGIFFYAGKVLAGVEIRGTIVSGNSATENGAGIYFYDGNGEGESGPLLLESVLLSDNTTLAEGRGGGLWFSGVAFHLQNSTVSGNEADDGGGINLDTQDGRSRIWNSTITDNTAGEFGGGIALNENAVDLVSSILAGNVAGEGDDAEDGDLFARFSLIGDATAGNLSGVTLHDLTPGLNFLDVDPVLDVLADNGGRSDTHALLVGSPAIDAGINTGLPFDQRGVGFDRSIGVHTDMGAFETATTAAFGPAGPSGEGTPTTYSPTLDGDSGMGTLRAAIEAANSNPGHDLIDATGITGPINLLSQIPITDAVSIIGPGSGSLTVDGGENGSIFDIDDGEGADAIHVEIVGMTLTGASDSAIDNEESLDLRDVVATGNSGSGGGGLSGEGNGRLDAVEFTENDASNDGGGLSWSEGFLEVRDSTISNNEAGNAGGGVFLDEMAAASFTETTIYDNDGYDYGGGVRLVGASPVTYAGFVGSTISGNETTFGSGGGISGFGETGISLDLWDTVVSGNTAGNGDNPADGGGIALDSGGRLRILGDSVIGDADTPLPALRSPGIAGVASAATLPGGNSASKGDGGGVFFHSEQRGDRLEIRDSTIRGNEAFYNGGGVGLHGYYAAQWIFDSLIEANQAKDGDGGGIDVFYSSYGAEASIWLVGATLSNNSAFGEAGEGAGGGMAFGSISLYGTLRIEDSLITGNTAAGDGGGLSLVSGEGFYAGVEIRNSEISDNQADSNGGGISFDDDGAYAHLVIVNSLVARNDAGSDGGGIWFYGSENTLFLHNSTVSGNEANSGGGIYAAGHEENMRIFNSTLVGNIASGGGNIGGLYSGDDVDIVASILSGSLGGVGGVGGSVPDSGGEGTFFTAFSLIQDPDGVTTEHFPGSNILDGTDPLLGPLQNNGGPTHTHALLPTSPALDTGWNASALAHDQRGGVDLNTGFLRIRNGRADMGAYEGATESLVTLALNDDMLLESIPESGTVTVQLSKVSGDVVVVNLGFSGSATYGAAMDWQRNPLGNPAPPIIIPAGLLSQAFDIDALVDVTSEYNETVIVDIDTVTNASEDGVQQVTATIIDDDPPLVSLDVSPAEIAEDGGVATVTATLSHTHTAEVIVTLGFGGTATGGDYNASNTQIVIPIGQLFASIQITGVGDALADDLETVIVTIDGVAEGVENGNQEGQTVLNEALNGPGDGRFALEIPTLGGLAKGLLGLLLAGFGWLFARRRD